MIKLKTEQLVNAGLLCLRIGMGSAIAYHGYTKIFAGNMDKFISGVSGMGFPLPVVFAWAAALSEFLGGIFIVVGLQTRAAAFFILCTMFVAVFIRHAADPFSVKELALAYGLVALSLLLSGPGSYSFDKALKKT